MRASFLLVLSGGCGLRMGEFPFAMPVGTARMKGKAILIDGGDLVAGHDLPGGFQVAVLQDDEKSAGIQRNQDAVEDSVEAPQMPLGDKGESFGGSRNGNDGPVIPRN